MKKHVLLFTAAAGLIYVTLSSYKSGPGLNGENRTGAQNSTTNCGGGGCHGGASANTTVGIVVDSTGGVPVTSYVPGMTYTIVVAGANTSALPNFGFQFAAVKGSGASQSNAGTFTGTLPTGVRHTTAAQSGTLDFIENKVSIAAATAGYYTESFSWTAPAAGTGNVTMYCTLNAADGNGSENSADKSGNTSTVLTEQVATSTASVNNSISVTAYPNPTVNSLTVDLKNVKPAQYHISIIDVSGRNVENRIVTVSGGNYSLLLNSGNWGPGNYFVHISNGTDMHIVPVIKQ